MTIAPPPASGAWRPGDDPGRRRFASVLPGGLDLEAGGHLPSVEVAYETWGIPTARRDNAVLVCHALTGDSHVTGPACPGHPQAGWWEGLVGPGRAIDTERYFVVCPNMLGGCQGTTGPASAAPDGPPWGSRFPRITVRDQVTVEAALADALGIDRWAAVVGGSMGGMRALEWPIMHPRRVDAAVVMATGPAASAEQIALQSAQVRAIQLDGGFRGGDYYDARPGDGPHEGLGLARRIGHLSYRTEQEMEVRFGRAPQGAEVPFTGGRYAIESYLDHHADKLVRRFDANSYLRLSEAMSHHDIGRGRGGVEAALRTIEATVTVLGISSDRLYPPALQRAIADGIPHAPTAQIVTSPYGHDGFLLETESLTGRVARTLEQVGSGHA